MQGALTWRVVLRRVNAALLLLVIGGVIVSIWIPESSYVAGASVILAAAVAIPILSRSQRWISLTLAIVGGAVLAFAISRGARLDIAWLGDVNEDIVALMTAISFVRLVTVAVEGSSRVTGWPAVIRTTVAYHGLAAVLNLSAVTIVGDRLSREGTLRPAETMLLSRGFSSASFWSPFWVATVIALSFVPAARTEVFLPVGALVAVVVVAFTIVQVGRRLGPDLADFTGYAFTPRLLALPAALVAGVLALHAVLPTTSLAIIITITVLVVTGVMFTGQRAGRARPTGAPVPPVSLPGHLESGLPIGESTMFAGAGILTVGLGALIDTGIVQLPLTEVSVVTAWAMVVAVTLLALVGVHPLISISAAGSILVPLDPNPSVFALACVLAWGTSVGTGPVSGLNLYIGARYGVSPVRTSRMNLPYAVLVILLALPALLLCQALTG